MSIDLNWETLTTGPDGERLASQIRDFVHAKFQDVQLPRFLKSVTVHGFEFGTVPPELEIKDITDPLPDFYDEDEEDEDGEDGDSEAEAAEEEELARSAELRRRERVRDERTRDAAAASSVKSATRFGHHHHHHHQDLGSPFLGVSTPGIMGGSNLHYFHSHIGGSQTPLAAVAGAHLGNSGWPSSSSSHHHKYSHSRKPSQSSVLSDDFNLHPPPAPPQLREKSSVSTLAPTSAGPSSRPPTRDTSSMTETAIAEEDDDEEEDESPRPRHRFREPRVEDVQAVFRIRYAGDVRLMLTAEILLDYPMPSFVGIPVKLNITGLTFDGVGVLANIRKRVHFCFLSPEDAVVAVGATEEAKTEAGSSIAASTAGSRRPSAAGDEDGRKGGSRFGGLLQEIKVESEIGQRDSGKQSLKNVGKVEKFVLEQVRRIFEDEFVYPSFWTFLV